MLSLRFGSIGPKRAHVHDFEHHDCVGWRAAMHLLPNFTGCDRTKNQSKTVRAQGLGNFESVFGPLTLRLRPKPGLNQRFAAKTGQNRAQTGGNPARGPQALCKQPRALARKACCGDAASPQTLLQLVQFVHEDKTQSCTCQDPMKTYDRCSAARTDANRKMTPSIPTRTDTEHP